MRFFEVVLSGAALISAALAVEFNSWPESVKAGEAITLTYSPKDVATTIILRKGPSTDLDTLDTITTSSTSGSFTWTIPSSLENGDDYAFEIRQEGADPNYTGQFSLSGGAASAVSSAYSTQESSSATAASSSAYLTASSAAYSTASSAAYSTASSAAYSTGASSAAYSTGVSTTIKTSLVTSAPSASAPSASGSFPSHGANSTISTGSPSGTPTGSTPPIENTGAASSFGVNAAALFGAFGVFAYLA